MIVHRNGVPHRVVFHWRGAALWVAQGALLAVVSGWVR